MADKDAADGLQKLRLSPAEEEEVARIRQARRRLSVSAGPPESDPSGRGLDGDPAAAAAAAAAAATAAAAADKDEAKDGEAAADGAAAGGAAAADEAARPFESFASLSKVGFVPFNNGKVNQDRAASAVALGGRADRALFGAYDGHGQLGHEVSSFVSREMPTRVLDQGATLDEDPAAALTAAFDDTQERLQSSGINCTFSGSTAVACLLEGPRIYTANAGDSRAVLGRAASAGAPRGSPLEAKPLSDDQKPDRPDERRRILDSRGRVQACRGPDGRDIGPPRVWLRYQDVPGLAMTRSFGDLVAASVGVIATPEVTVHERTPEDRLLILASDGVWEFISSEEAVRMVERAETPQDACRILVQEATRRWKAEEDVIDDITALVIFL